MDNLHSRTTRNSAVLPAPCVANSPSASANLAGVTIKAEDALGQYNLGRRYEQGQDGLPQDDREAARLYRLAAERGNVAAKHSLGRFYEQGLGGLDRNDRAAARFYKIAAEDGSIAALYDLGRLVEAGRGGLPIDLNEAARLYKLAADQGDQPAASALARYNASAEPAATLMRQCPPEPATNIQPTMPIERIGKGAAYAAQQEQIAPHIRKQREEIAAMIEKRRGG